MQQTVEYQMHNSLPTVIFPVLLNATRLRSKLVWFIFIRYTNIQKWVTVWNIDFVANYCAILTRH